MTDSPTFTGHITWPDLTDEALDRAVNAWFNSYGLDTIDDDLDAHWRNRMRAAITAARTGV
jgi:hypothetical protein